MGDPRRLRPDEVEILVARELRKAGMELSKLKVRARTPLSKAHDDEYAMQLSGLVQVGGADHPVLIECRSERQPVRADAVRALSAKVAEQKAKHGIMFSTSGYEPDAVREARAHGVPLLSVTDGKEAFARSQWGMAGQPPAWVPEYMAEVVDLDVTGQLRHHLIISGESRLILDRLEKGGDVR
jgi:Restriction endonuclease